MTDNPERIPVLTAEDLLSLDQAEIVEGYLDGLNNWPCGDNRSRSYWHGWMNSQRDRHKEPPGGRALVRDMRKHGLLGKVLAGEL